MTRTAVQRRELTKRQIEVLRLIAYGRTNAQIAVVLGISRQTATNHISNIYQKLRVAGRIDAMLMGIERGYYSIDDVMNRLRGRGNGL